MWNYAFFTQKEMSCPCGCVGLPKDEFMRRLVTMRTLAKFPFVISSAYRCPEYNAKVSNGSLDGPHTRGLAADVVVYGERALQVMKLGLQTGMVGIGINQKGSTTKRFIHVDCVKPGEPDMPRPWIWSY